MFAGLTGRERGRLGRKVLEEGPLTASEPTPAGTIPRIAHLMALAKKFDQLLRDDKVADLSELARLAHVSQPRKTQIMKLSLLAPSIQ